MSDRWLGKLVAQRYRVIAKLGEGESSEVWLARHVLLDRRVRATDRDELGGQPQHAGHQDQAGPPRSSSRHGTSALLVVRVSRRHNPGGRAQSLTVVVNRHAGHVHGQAAGGGLHVDHHDDRAPLDAIPEDDLTAARQPRTCRLPVSGKTFGAFGAQNNS